MEIVDWYIQVLEDGKNTKYIVEEYLKQKEVIQKQEKILERHQETI